MPLLWSKVWEIESHRNIDLELEDTSSHQVQLHFTDEEIDPERVKDLPMVRTMAELIFELWPLILRSSAPPLH